MKLSHLKYVMLALVLVLALVLAAGCGSKQAQKPASPLPPPGPEGTAPTGLQPATPADQTAEAPAATDNPKDVLTSLQQKLSNTKSWQMEGKLSGPAIGAERTTTLMRKGNKLRVESSADPQHYSILNLDDNEMLLVDTNSKTVTKMKLGSKEDQKLEEMDPSESISKLLEKPSLAFKETTLNGKRCWLLEYKEGSTPQKIWVDQKIGLPIRIETEQNRKQLVEEFNYSKLNAVPDSAFEVPAGYKVIDLDFTKPGGGALSPEQLKQLEKAFGDNN